MSDRITITGLRVKGFHGVYDFEAREGQDFVIDISIDTSLERAGHTDDLGDTLNYGSVATTVADIVRNERFDLIEALGERIAQAVLDCGVHAVDVTVHKPQAPIAEDFDDVSVHIRRTRLTKVVIALGSNLGEPSENIARAAHWLGTILSDAEASPQYESEAHTLPGQDPQPPFANMVVMGSTDIPPHQLLTLLHAYEDGADRDRSERWSARPIDLDIISYGDLRCDDPILTLPHPRAHERSFVLRPWLDLNPDAELAGRPVADYLDSRGNDGLTQIAPPSPLTP